MNIAPLLWKSLPSLKGTHRAVLRCAAFAGLATCLIYVVGNAVSFIVQLFELSSSEASKFIKVIAALLNRPNLDLEFLPQEFEDVDPGQEGVYSYASGNSPLLFRRASGEEERGAWQWTDDGRQWFATDSFRESTNGVPEPPALVFILRLHVEYLIRRRLANPAARHRRLPPPLDLDSCSRSRIDSAPEPLCCPISHGLMRLPVVAPSGTTFEYDCIRRWAQRHNTDPVNGCPLAEGDLYPNLALRDIIERWISQQQQGREGKEVEQQQPELSTPPRDEASGPDWEGLTEQEAGGGCTEEGRSEVTERVLRGKDAGTSGFLQLCGEAEGEAFPAEGLSEVFSSLSTERRLPAVSMPLPPHLVDLG